MKNDDYKHSLTYANMANSGSITVSSTGDCPYYELATGTYQTPAVSIPTVWLPKENNKKGDDNMRYLYEVILVNPKNEAFLSVQIIARSETSALMKAYDKTDMFDAIDFDDLKTSCRVLMEWKKKESLKKAIETIKKAVE